MASPERTLTVVRSPIAIDDIHGIWLWNAKSYSPAQADVYVEFLEASVDALARQYPLGKTVGARPDLRYMIIRRKAKGHGHVAVYRVVDPLVEVLHVFHSSQDWQAKLSEDSGS